MKKILISVTFLSSLLVSIDSDAQFFDFGGFGHNISLSTGVDFVKIQPDEVIESFYAPALSINLTYEITTSKFGFYTPIRINFGMEKNRTDIKDDYPLVSDITYKRSDYKFGGIGVYYSFIGSLDYSDFTLLGGADFTSSESVTLEVMRMMRDRSVSFNRIKGRGVNVGRLTFFIKGQYVKERLIFFAQPYFANSFEETAIIDTYGVNFGAKFILK